MKLTSSSSIDLRLAAYAAAGVALAAPALSSTAKADIVYSGPLSLAVPSTLSGIYLNFVTGVRGTSGTAVPGYDFNPYLTAGNLAFFFTTTNGDSGLTQNGTNYAVLQAFDYVGPFSTFLTSTSTAATSNFRAGETGGYLGIKFLNEVTGISNYAWLSINTTGATGFPATITGYAYENTGAALPAGFGPNGLVPEPSTTAAMVLGTLALGAVGVRRMRQAQQATA